YRIAASQPGFGGALANLLQPDPVNDRAYNELLMLLVEPSPEIDQLRAQLQSRPNDLLDEQARQRAERWHQDHFAGRTFSFPAFESEEESGFPAMRAHGTNCSVRFREAKP